MGIGSSFAEDLSDLILNGVAIPNIAGDAATAPLTSLYMALHTADPGAGGSQTTSEATYTGYARQAIARDGTRWTVSGLTATLVGDEDFPTATAGTESLTHMSIGTDASGAGAILFIARIEDGAGSASPIAISAGSLPRIEAGTQIVFSAVAGA